MASEQAPAENLDEAFVLAIDLLTAERLAADGFDLAKSEAHARVDQILSERGPAAVSDLMMAMVTVNDSLLQALAAYKGCDPLEMWEAVAINLKESGPWQG